MDYLFLKTIHVISSTVLYGTGLGIAFFMWITNRSKNLQAMRVTTKNVIRADLFFTTPAVILQPITGVLLALNAGYSLTVLNWLTLSIALYFVAGVCWLPVLWLQWKMHDVLEFAESIPPVYWKLEKFWVLLGIPAFFSLSIVFWLMVSKPVFNLN